MTLNDMSNHAARLWWILLIWLALAGPASGDGMKVPQQGVRAYPDIPYQEAFIAHRDGVETLIIQSSIDGEGDRFGWVVPVPAAPTHFEAVAPGVFDVLKQAVAPRVQMESNLFGYALASIFLLFMGAMVITPQKHSRFVSWLGFAFLLFFLYVISIPAFSKVRSMDGVVPGIEVEQSIRVGNYEVVVLRGDSPASLNQWLADNDFQALPPEASVIVADYIQEGWRFIATKLLRTTTDGQTLAPHPLRMDFPAKVPVYPMRLTALNTGKEGMRLELFVAADGTPVPPPLMAIEESGQFHGPLPLARHRRNGPWSGHDDKPLGFRNEARRVSIALPDLLPVLWDGVQLTRMTGVFKQGDMTRDIELNIGSAIDQRAHYFSVKAALAAALGSAALMGAGVFLAFSIIARRRKTPYPEALKGCLAGFLGSGVVLFLVLYLWLPVETVERLSGGRWLLGHTMRERLYVAHFALEESEEPLSEENFLALFKQALSVHYSSDEEHDPRNPPPIEEASPGNYIILDEGGEMVIRFFDYDGAPMDLRASDYAM